jgi:hypothetical protein
MGDSIRSGEIMFFLIKNCCKQSMLKQILLLRIMSIEAREGLQCGSKETEDARRFSTKIGSRKNSNGGNRINRSKCRDFRPKVEAGRTQTPRGMGEDWKGSNGSQRRREAKRILKKIRSWKNSNWKPEELRGGLGDTQKQVQ